jgi:lipopolysaccharide export LptBFGC system permease protein LptF
LEAATVLRAEKLMTALALKELKKNEQLEINRTAKAHYDSLNEEEKAAVDNDKKEEKESQKALKETSRLLKATKTAKKIEDANRVVEAAKTAKEAKENEDARLLLG